MIRKGMTVRTPDGERLGHVHRIGSTEFTIKRGILGHEFVAKMDHVIAVDDENDELICRPVDLPPIDREIEEMMFGAPETPDELINREEDDELAQSLEPLPREVDPHGD